MRRILITLLILIVVGGGAFLLYKKNTATVTPATTPNGFTGFTTPDGAVPVGGSDGNLNETPATVPDTAVPAPTSAFKQVVKIPIAGYTAFTRTKTITIPATDPKKKPTTQTVTEHVIRYVARSNGYVYEIVDGGTPLQISNIYIPNIYEASFIDDNQTAVLRFLRDDMQTIATYAVPIPGENKDGTRTQKQGTYLPDNITSLAVSPDQKALARITDEGATAALTTTTSVNGSKKELIRTPFHEFLASWPTSGSIYLQTKASASSEGFLYLVDQANRRLNRVLGNIAGLTTSVSPSGTYILYSESAGQTFTTKLFNTKTNNTLSLNISVLPEKCSWLKDETLLCAGNTSVPEATYPDSWYAGVTAFSDKIYHIYTKNNIFDTLYAGGDTTFDMVSLQTDENIRTMYFILKSTGQLWQFKY